MLLDAAWSESTRCIVLTQRAARCGISCVRQRGDGTRRSLRFVFSCYTGFVLKNVTVTIPEEVALWARKKAAEENTSVSRLIARMLEAQMRHSDDYSDAYRRWTELPSMDLNAANRLSREEAHERR